MTGEENRQRVRAELDRAERALAAERFWARRERRETSRPEVADER